MKRSLLHGFCVGFRVFPHNKPAWLGLEEAGTTSFWPVAIKGVTRKGHIEGYRVEYILISSPWPREGAYPTANHIIGRSYLNSTHWNSPVTPQQLLQDGQTSRIFSVIISSWSFKPIEGRRECWAALVALDFLDGDCLKQENHRSMSENYRSVYLEYIRLIEEGLDNERYHEKYFMRSRGKSVYWMVSPEPIIQGFTMAKAQSTEVKAHLPRDNSLEWCAPYLHQLTCSIHDFDRLKFDWFRQINFLCDRDKLSSLLASSLVLSLLHSLSFTFYKFLIDKDV